MNFGMDINGRYRRNGRIWTVSKGAGLQTPPHNSLQSYVTSKLDSCLRRNDKVGG